MRIKILLPAVMIMALLQSCVKNEFKVEFALGPGVSTSYRLFYYASDKRTGWHMETIATVDKGKGDARCITRLPTIVYLYTLGSGRPVLVFYASRGDDVKITGTTDDPYLWEIGGNSINEGLSLWRKANADVLRKGDAAGINTAVAEFVVKNPDSVVSTILLLTAFSRRDDEKGFASLWRRLEGDALDEDMIRLIGRTDQPAVELSREGQVKAMKLHCVGDTMRVYDPKKYAATILYFWRNGGAKRQETIDSLRRLTLLPAYKDRGMVVSINFDAEDMAWMSSARTDSLDNAFDAWIFAGEADSRMLGLGVPRTPYFIVADRKGRQLYRGSDYVSASRVFRKTISPKPVKKK